jgi:hypothetical protein
MKANLFMDSLFWLPEKISINFAKTLPKTKFRDVICYGRIQNSPAGKRKGEDAKAFRKIFSRNFPERLPKLKTCEVIMYERENRRDIWKRFKGIFPK